MKKLKAELVAQTTIINKADMQADYPHCSLPPHFFDRVMYLKRKAVSEESHHSRPVLTVQTWDGRDVLSVLTD